MHLLQSYVHEHTSRAAVLHSSECVVTNSSEVSRDIRIFILSKVRDLSFIRTVPGSVSDPCAFFWNIQCPFQFFVDHFTVGSLIFRCTSVQVQIGPSGQNLRFFRRAENLFGFLNAGDKARGTYIGLRIPESCF